MVTKHFKPITLAVNKRIDEKADRNAFIYRLSEDFPEMTYDNIAITVAHVFKEPKMTRQAVYKHIKNQEKKLKAQREAGDK